MTQPDDAAAQPRLTESQVRERIAERTASVVNRVVSVMAKPTFAMILAPILPAAILIILGFLAPGKIWVFTSAIGLFGIALGARMWWLRRRFLWAVRDETAFAAEINRALDIKGHVVDARDQTLTQIESSAPSVTSMSDARRALSDIGLGANFRGQVADLTRLKPFMPGALRSTFLTGTLCFTTAGVLTMVNIALVIIAIIAAI